MIGLSSVLLGIRDPVVGMKKKSLWSGEHVSWSVAVGTLTHTLRLAPSLLGVSPLLFFFLSDRSRPSGGRVRLKGTALCKLKRFWADLIGRNTRRRPSPPLVRDQAHQNKVNRDPKGGTEISVG